MGRLFEWFCELVLGMIFLWGFLAVEVEDYRGNVREEFEWNRGFYLFIYMKGFGEDCGWTQGWLIEE